MNSARIAVFGYSDVGYACLKFLIERGENIVALYSHADKPQEKIWFPSIVDMAKSKKIPTYLDVDFSDPKNVAQFKSLNPDILFSFYYRNMIPASIFSIPKLGAFNMHGSLLPKYRGRAPVNWAVLHGEKETGATLHHMVEKADAGDIVDQGTVPIGPDDTSLLVQTRVTEAAIKVLARQIDNLKLGKAPRKAQDATHASYFGRRSAADGKIDWSWPAQKIHNLVRAVTKPYPGAFGEIEGQEHLIWKTCLSGKKVTSGPAGKFIRDDGKLFVICGDTALIEIIDSEIKGDVVS